MSAHTSRPDDEQPPCCKRFYTPHALPSWCRPHRVCGLYAIQPGQTLTLADFDGPGCIRRLYLTMQPRRLRDLVLTHTQDRWYRWSTWGLYVKFLERDGSLADDLAFENFRGLDPTPERWREPWPPHETGIDSDDYRDPLFLV